MPKLLNKTNLPNYASAPSSPANGDIYYNTTDHIVYARINGTWVDLGAGGGGSGDITDVVAGSGLTGGATSGSATINVGAGTGITVNADDVAIDTTVVARKTDKLSDFAATSSSELAGVISDETGSGALVFGTGPTLSQPVIDNPKLGYATTATSAGTLTLTNTSGYYQFFTGSTPGQIVQLPVASTMALGQSFLIANGSSAAVTVQSSGSNTVQSVTVGAVYLITCILTSGTTAASWQARFVGSSSAITGNGSVVLSNQPTFTGRVLFSDAISITPTAVTASGGSTAISSTADGYIRVTGSTTHTLTLPGAGNAGQWYWIRNDSTGAVTINASGGGLVATLASGQAAEVICLASGGTTAADWAVHFLGASTVTGTGAEVRASSPTLVTPNLGAATATSINGTTIPSSATLVTTGDTGSVTSTMILDGTIVNGDISASAAIALSKLATDPLARANHTGTQTASTISDFDTQVRTSKVTDLAAPTSSFSMNGQKITSLGTPAADTDAATKAYVDGVAQGLDIKASVRAATTVPITLSGTQTIDGVSLIASDRVLVKDQSSAVDNGIYVVSASTWSRADDAAQAGEITPGTFVFVEEGTTNADSGWVMTSNGTITIGSTAMAWSQFSGAGQIVAGTGISKSGNTLSVNNTVVPTISGSNTVTFTAGATTALTLPVSGTVATTSNKLSSFASTTSAELAEVISDETGSNKLVFSDSPTLVTPTLGVASATSVNKVAITAPATSATLTIADGKTLTASNTLTFTGTDASSVAFGDGGTVLYSGGALGTPSSGTLTNASGLPVSGITSSTTQALGVGSIELGHATDTTITRSSEGVIAVEGVALVNTNDARLTDSRTPTAHATSHKSGGTDAIKLNEFAAPDADVSLNSQKITNLATPTSSADAATKAYVDAVAEGLDIKASVRVATTVDLASLSTLLTIDGISLNADDRVLVKNQTNAVDNGIYLAKSGSWERAADAAQNGELTPGTFVFVEVGSTNADSGWVMTSDGTITIGATAMNWTQFSGAGQITAGTGITKSANTLSVDTSVVATLSGSQSLSNKTIASAVLTGDTTINAQGDLRFADSDSSHYAAIQAPATIETNYTLTLPTTDGNASEYLKTDGSGVLSWGPVATVYYQTTQPTGGTYAAGDIWIDSDDNTTPNTNALSMSTKTASYTIASDLSDYPDKVIEMNVSSANTVSVPTDATANYPIGTQIHVFQLGTGQTTIQAVTSGTTTVVGTPGTKLRAQYSFATLIKRAANYWIVVGDTAA